MSETPIDMGYMSMSAEVQAELERLWIIQAQLHDMPHAEPGSHLRVYFGWAADEDSDVTEPGWQVEQTSHPDLTIRRGRVWPSFGEALDEEVEEHRREAQREPLTD